MNHALHPPIKSTTVVAVHYKGELAIGADGQATLGSTIAKGNVKKLRLLAGGKVLSGFAGSSADARTLVDFFEEKLRAHTGNMYRAALALAKAWRVDRSLRRLESVIIVADKEQILVIFGNGDVMRPDTNIAAIGSGGTYAYSAALALKKHAPQLTAREIVEESLKIAADICIYTNHNRTIETLPTST